MSYPLTIKMFGPLQVLIGETPATSVRSRKALWLLALLTLRSGRPVTRTWVANTLWPDADLATALANLRPVIHDLRHILGEQAHRLQSQDRAEISIDLDGANVDLLVFDAAITRGTPSDLVLAIELYKGSLLEDCAEEWVPQERDTRQLNCVNAYKILAEDALATNRLADATTYYQRLSILDPWLDACRRGLMTAYARSGDVNAALRTYRDFANFLKSDGLFPDNETSELYARLRARARQGARPPGKLKPANKAATIGGHLPHAPNGLIGREDERLEIAASLREHRLVTLCGIGGIGKTRLASAVASEFPTEHPDGIWLVSLEALSDGHLVAESVLSILGTKGQPGRPALDTICDSIKEKNLLLVLDNCEHVKEAVISLLAPLLQRCARVRILATSREALGVQGEKVWLVPALPFAEPANLPQSQSTMVRVLGGYDSVQLFVQRAQAVCGSFELNAENAISVARICFRTEGIPLAIELAASRVAGMSPAQIVERLDNHFRVIMGGRRTVGGRQQTLRSTLDWSFALLSEQERELLKRLSIFRGGWTLEAAEEVCSGPSMEPGDVDDLLIRLVEKSMVAFEPERPRIHPRYRLLEMVRQYALEAIAEGNVSESGDRRSGLRDMRFKHRKWSVAFGDRCQSEYSSAELEENALRIVPEHDNLVAAFDTCDEDPISGLKLSRFLSLRWNPLRHSDQVVQKLRVALDHPGAQEPTIERARALISLANLYAWQGQHHKAREYAEESLAIFRHLENESGIAECMNRLGISELFHGDFAQALKLYQINLAMARSRKDDFATALALNNAGIALLQMGECGSARQLQEEALELVRGLGYKRRLGLFLHALGNVLAEQEDHPSAQLMFEEALQLLDEDGSAVERADVQSSLGSQLISVRDFAMSRHMLSEALETCRKMGIHLSIGNCLAGLGNLALAEGELENAQQLLNESVLTFRIKDHLPGVARSLTDLARALNAGGLFNQALDALWEALRIQQKTGAKKGVASNFITLASICFERADFEASTSLVAVAETLRTACEWAWTPAKGQKVAELLAALPTRLGESSFELIWSKGTEITWEAALEQVLEFQFKARPAPTLQLLDKQ